MKYQFDTPWHQQNLQEIQQRLSPFLQKQDLAKIIPSEIQGVFIRAVDEIIELYCYDPETRNLSDIMSRVNLNNPLDLIAIYNQVLFLTFVWSNVPPEQTYIAGFGGGRLGMVTHHYNQTAKIDGSDFDPTIVEIAASHFGIDYDERYSINVADSAEDFDSRNSTYNTVIIDVFSNDGEQASHLATRDFFQKCSSKLSRDGVLAINLIERDEKREVKISNLATVFPHLVEWRSHGSHLVFASQTEPDLDGIISRAEQFENTANLNYPYSNHAKALRRVSHQHYLFG